MAYEVHVASVPASGQIHGSIDGAAREASDLLEKHGRDREVRLLGRAEKFDSNGYRDWVGRPLSDGELHGFADALEGERISRGWYEAPPPTRAA